MGRRRRLPLMVSDSDPELWVQSRQEQELIAELEAIPTARPCLCPDENCWA